MKAAVLRALGTPPRCELFDEPEAREGEAIVRVRAAALKPVDKQLAEGTHYASPRTLPAVCGIDGVGQLEDGQRVFFGGTRAPFGAMAERTVVRQAFCFPVPEGLDDATAAAVPNPGVSAWLSLAHRAKLQPGEQVLILGATGVTGQLAVKIAKLLGAGRVVAAGRNSEVLAKLPGLGADATIQLDAPGEELRAAFTREGGERGFQVVIDYVWGGLRKRCWRQSHERNLLRSRPRCALCRWRKRRVHDRPVGGGAAQHARQHHGDGRDSAA